MQQAQRVRLAKRKRPCYISCIFGHADCIMFCLSKSCFSILCVLNLFKNLNLCTTSYIQQIMKVFSFMHWNKYFHTVKDEMYHSTQLRLLEWSISPHENICTIELINIIKWRVYFQKGLNTFSIVLRKSPFSRITKLHFINSDNFVVNERCRSSKPTLVSLLFCYRGFYVFLYFQQFVDVGSEVTNFEKTIFLDFFQIF